VRERERHSAIVAEAIARAADEDADRFAHAEAVAARVHEEPPPID
jgi:hypothetical protein